jgi:inosine-uridine nucleoside N-ribohydrolase
MKDYKKSVNYGVGLLLGLYTSVCLASVTPFIIDTDVGIDDAIAIIYFASKPQIKILALTIASDGLSPCKTAFPNARGLLALMGKQAIPVACGDDQPLRGGHVFPAIFREHQKRWLNTANFFPLDKTPVTHHAVDLLITELRRSPQPVAILAIGPLTNIAEALQKDPAIKQKISRVYCMGGAIHVAGNVGDEVTQPNRRAEWNIYADPKAAAIVLATLPVTLIPLDVTNQLPLNHAFYQQLKRHHQSLAAKYLYQVVTDHQQLLQSGGWYFWDVVAAVAAIKPQLFNAENIRLSVALEPLTAGSLVTSQNGQTLQVMMRVNQADFNKELLKSID